ncbi:MAG: hypothetical protein KBS62_06500 [Oscillospiraceae bacterium]|nr:hypothetical protein [Candidatus Ruminococcus equi]
MVRVEVLFPEIANLSGDLQNIAYLKRCSDEIEVIEDNLIDEPMFLSEKPDLIYLGNTTESGQKIIIEKLSLYKEKIIELINENVYFLVTGNALEIFGRAITDNDGKNLAGLDFFPIITKCDMLNRYNSLYLGNFVDNENEIKIVGFKSQFGHSYWTDKETSVFDKECGYVFDTIKGAGLNPDITFEGIRKNNFLATYIIGPILILNPLFTKWLLKEIGVTKPALYLEEDIMTAYNARLVEYSAPDKDFIYH